MQTDVLSVLENDALTSSKMVRIVALMRLFVKDLKTKIKQRKMIRSDEVAKALIITTMIQESRMPLLKIGAAETFQRRM